MRTLHLMLLRSFISFFIIAILFFILVLQLLDVFANLWRYLAQDTSIAEIFRISLLYLPKCISYALPPSLLFACSYTLGILYKNNELIAVLGSGVSLYRLVIPFIAIGVLLSIAGFYFDENLVIETFRMKNELYRSTLKLEITLSNTNVTVLSEDARTVYQVEYYNDKKQTITEVMILRRDESGRFMSRIDADWAEWNGKNWVLHNGRRYLWNETLKEVTAEKIGLLDAEQLTEPPSTFRKTTRNVDEMGSRQARDWVKKLKKAGLPYREALTEYYKKFFFAFSPFIVSLIASGVGGRFRRNILLMNLLTALILSVIYYVAQMILLILAKNGYIPPLAGAGFSFFAFLGAGFLIVRTART